MGYCRSCGAEHANDSNFCKKCGTRIVSNSNNTNLPEVHPHKNSYNGSKRKKKIIIIVSLILCAALLVILLCNPGTSLFSGFGGLNVEYSEQGIGRFLTKVCRKVDGQAQLASSNSDSPGNMYGECYIPVVTVKRSGRIAEEIPLRFYNTGSYDMVSSIEMILYSFNRGGFSAPDYENIFECEKAVLIALEKTVAGKSYVADHLTTQQEVRKQISNGNTSKTVVLATYQLSDDLTVVIKGKNDGAWGTSVYYTLTKGSSR